MSDGPPPGHDSSITGAPTIYDVARLAGVSPSTVSWALSRPGRLNAETEKTRVSRASPAPATLYR